MFLMSVCWELHQENAPLCKIKLMVLIISWSWCAYPLYLRHSTALISRVLSFSRNIQVFSSQSHVHACVILLMSAVGKRAQFCLYCASLMSSLSRCYWTDVANPLACTRPISFHLQSDCVRAGRLLFPVCAAHFFSSPRTLFTLCCLTPCQWISSCLWGTKEKSDHRRLGALFVTLRAVGGIGPNAHFSSFISSSN